MRASHKNTKTSVLDMGGEVASHADSAKRTSQEVATGAGEVPGGQETRGVHGEMCRGASEARVEGHVEGHVGGEVGGRVGGGGGTCGGAKTWYFPDGYLPAKRAGDEVEAHEALMILNVVDQPARIQLDFYFEDRPPVLDVAIEVGAMRVRCIRLDHPEDINGVKLPVCTQYAIRLRSNVKTIVQQGRIDTTQTNLSYYGSMGFCE